MMKLLRTADGSRHLQRHSADARVIAAGVFATIVATCLASANAAPLTGRVVASDGRGIPDASVSVVSTGAQATDIAITDQTGAFTLPNACGGQGTSAQLTASAFGYLEQTVVLAFSPAQPCTGIVIALADDPNAAADEVIDVFDRRHVTRTLGTTALTGQELMRVPGGEQDALAAIRALPGVTIGGGAGPGSGLVIRGSSPEDSLTLLDGVPVPRAYHTFNNTTIIPTRLIGTLDFVPSGAGAEDGNNTGGVMRLTSKQLDRHPSEAVLTASLLELGAFGHVRRDNGFALGGGARRSTLDWLIDGLNLKTDDVAFEVAPIYYDAQLKADYARGAHRFSALAFTSYDDISATIDNDFSPFSRIANTTRFTRLIATWRYEGPRVGVSTAAAIGKNVTENSVGDSNYLDGDRVPMQLRQDVQVPFGAQREHLLRTGSLLEVSKTHVDTFSPLPPSEGAPGEPFSGAVISLKQAYWRSVVAAYAASDWRLNDTLAATTGARLEYFSGIDAWELLPRVAAQNQFGNITAHAAVGRYARSLTLIEGASTSLSPETATQYLLGAEAQWRAISWVLSGYVSQRKHLVVASADPAVAANDPNGLPYVSTGRGATAGVEVIAKLFRKHWFGWVAYSYARSTRRDGPYAPLRRFDYDQPHNIVAMGSYQRGAWLFSARFSYASGTPYTKVESATYQPANDTYVPVYGELNGERLPAQHQLDLRVERTWRIGPHDLTAFLDFQNVYRRTKTTGYQYNRDFTARLAITEYMPPPSLGLRLAFAPPRP